MLLPVKDFRRAKARLAPVLSPTMRMLLARWSAQRVLNAADTLPTFVVCDDGLVAEWAESNGATVLWRPHHGLNGAVAAGLDELRELGYGSTIVAHSDLPLATSLSQFVQPGRVVLVPDARDDGTNVMVIPSETALRPSYGSQSFRRHLDAARELGCSIDVVHHPACSLDLDTPDDLVHPMIAEVLPSWLRTNQDNLRSSR